MTVTKELITTLRQKTGVGMMDAKRALEEVNGDLDKAIGHLRKQGEKVAEKKGERATHQGIVDAYVHANGKVAAVVALACETDFVARTDEFKKLAHDIAMHIAASEPTYITPEDIPEEEIEKERAIYTEQMKDEGKPKNVVKKIIDGKIGKYEEQVTLMKQPFVKDDVKTIEQLLQEHIQSLGENIVIVDFSRIML